MGFTENWKPLYFVENIKVQLKEDSEADVEMNAVSVTDSQDLVEIEKNGTVLPVIFVIITFFIVTSFHLGSLLYT